MKKLLFLLFFIPLVSFGQDYGNSADAIKLCTFIQTNNFTTDAEAEKGLDRILSVIGASKRFVLQPCSNINNAIAASYKGIRYIFYDRNFMSSVNSGNNWENLFILAHEVGHHINGHSLDLVLYAVEVVEPKTLANKRKQELEADEFAGFILGKLGATLEQTSAAMNLIASNKDGTYSTHPSKSKRLAAINKGYNKALGNKTVVYQTPTNLQTAEEYFYSAYGKAENGEYYGAIKDYTRAIELDPDLAGAYYNRGVAKYNLEDYSGAISDYSKAIELDPDLAAAYYNRGLAKYNLKDYSGAIADYNKAIELDPDYADAYYNRGNAKSSFEWDVIIESLDGTKNELYSKNKLFISETWKSANDVIQLDDKETGILLLKSTTTSNYKNASGTFRYTVKLYSRDGKVRIKLSNVYLENNPYYPVSSTYPSEKGRRKTRLSIEKYLKFMKKLHTNLKSIINRYEEEMKKPIKKGDW